MNDPQHEEPQLPQPNNNPQVQIIQSEFSGPLPPPAILAQYDRVVPGAAERIITMAEEQSRHRRPMESQLVVSDIADARRGF
jgi:uncharacterized membrane protein